METSRGWSMPVIPPGITPHSVFNDCNVLRTGFDRCARNESHTSIDFRWLKPPTLLQTVFSQSFTRSSFIHPYSWHLTTSPWGNTIFFGSVLRSKTTYGGSFVPSPRQASITVNLSLSCPVVRIGTLLIPSSATVLFVTMSNVKGVWSALPICFSSKLCCLTNDQYSLVVVM